MRKNGYDFIDEFVSQYTGVWNPSEGHWLGLDFSYNDNEYRLQTGPMYEERDTILPNGKTAVFYLYERLISDEQKVSAGTYAYKLIGEYATIEELLSSSAIEGELFQSVIMDDSTELLGQD